MLLGEGAAMLVLERLDDALARNAKPLAEVGGLGLSSDAHHPTAPRPDGRGMRRAMQAALAEAGVCPSEVDWVNVHGTGTRASDSAEGRALREVKSGSRVDEARNGSASRVARRCVGDRGDCACWDCVIRRCRQRAGTWMSIRRLVFRVRANNRARPLRVVMNNAFALEA
jgi:3-oxoacyl-[acyl-carrier-protein] synthase II